VTEAGIDWREEPTTGTLYAQPAAEAAAVVWRVGDGWHWSAQVGDKVQRSTSTARWGAAAGAAAAVRAMMGPEAPPPVEPPPPAGLRVLETDGSGGRPVRRVETTLSDGAALDLIRDLPRDFPRSLVAASRTPGGLSRNQRVWVHVLALEEIAWRAAEAEREAARAAYPAPPGPEGTGDEPMPGVTLAGIVALFARGGERLVRPKVRMVHPITGARLLLASPKGKADTIHLREDRHGGQYYGRLDAAGRFYPSRWFRAEDPAAADDRVAVLELLAELDADPVAVARRFGRLTGACCFCGIKLDDERSIAAGYGPICSKRYSLPYGSDETANAERKDRIRKAKANI
jgi:hypothetical protein